MKKHIQVLYSGRVQGVGFRFTAEESARRLGVVGWVKNLRDGRVELVAEGDERMLTRFLEDIRTGPMQNFIKDTEVSWSTATNEFHEFDIHY